MRYADTRQVLQTLIDDLATVDATLAPLKDATVKLPLRFGLIKIDINGDGKVGAEESFWKIFAAVNRLGITAAQAQAFTIAFDAGDAVWLRGLPTCCRGCWSLPWPTMDRIALMRRPICCLPIRKRLTNFWWRGDRPIFSPRRRILVIFWPFFIC